MNAHPKIPVPNADVISAFLYTLFSPELVHGFPDAWIDITCIRPDKTVASSFFSAHDLKRAVDHVVKMNTAGWNCYVGAALRQGERPKAGERSGKKHFCAASHFWVDLDGAGDYERAVEVCKREHVDVAMLNVTGTKPHTRAQIWIRSAKPITSIPELEGANVSLRDALNGDKVQNADRIMRIAGTVNLPPRDKTEKGYEVELTKMTANARALTFSAAALRKLCSPRLAGTLRASTSERGKSFADAGYHEQYADREAGEAGRLTDADMLALLSKHPNGAGDGWHNDMLAVTHELLCRDLEPFAIQMVVGSACRRGWSDPDIGRLICKKWDEFQAAKREVENVERAAKAAAEQKQVDPVDLWGRFEPPSLPRGMLPDILERFAWDQGTDMGADLSGIAMSALTVCAAAITDTIRLQVKRHNKGWLEAARLWVTLVGPPSAKKTPIMAAAARPLRKIDAAQARDYAERRSFYEKLPKEEKALTDPPKQVRSVLQDVTIEAAQDVLKDSPDGMLCYQDELSGWFGAMDKYSAGRGSSKDRAFWLEAFNGGPYSVQRVGRGSVFIENLSISLVGGIQPEPIRRVANDSVDDGLLQRLLPITLRPAVAGRDEQASHVVAEYEELIGRLNALGPALLRFDDGAQSYRQELEAQHLRLQSLEIVHRKLAAHIGKYDGIFARLCVIWHCIENAPPLGDMSVTIISAATARRVGAFLHGFILPHAIGFYAGVLGLSNDHDSVTAVAGYILSHKLEKITNRALKRGDQTMRRLRADEALATFEQLEALGWLDRIPAPRRGGPDHWAVNPAVHQKFAERAKTETARRAEVRQMIADAVGKRIEP